MKKILYVVLVFLLLLPSTVYGKESHGRNNEHQNCHNPHKEKNNHCRMTDSQRVQADKAALAIRFGGSDTASSVTVPLKWLPTTGVYGSKITWMSNNPSVLSNNGKVLNRPATADVTVIVKATIRYKKATDAKLFTLTVKHTMSDTQKVAADKAALAIGFGGSDTASSVTIPLLSLPSIGPNGSSIFWFSSNPSILSNDGKILNRPASGTGDANVTLTAIIISNGAADLKPFLLIVKQR